MNKILLQISCLCIAYSCLIGMDQTDLFKEKLVLFVKQQNQKLVKEKQSQQNHHLWCEASRVKQETTDFTEISKALDNNGDINSGLPMPSANGKKQYRVPLIFLPITRNNINFFEFLLKNNASPYAELATENHIATLLQYIIHEWNQKRITDLENWIDLYATSGTINAKDSIYGYSALDFAIKLKNLNAVKILLQKNIDPYNNNNYGTWTIDLSKHYLDKAKKSKNNNDLLVAEKIHTLILENMHEIFYKTNFIYKIHQSNVMLEYIINFNKKEMLGKNIKNNQYIKIIYHPHTIHIPFTPIKIDKEEYDNTILMKWDGNDMIWEISSGSLETRYIDQADKTIYDNVGNYNIHPYPLSTLNERLERIYSAYNNGKIKPYHNKTTLEEQYKKQQELILSLHEQKSKMLDIFENYDITFIYNN